MPVAFLAPVFLAGLAALAVPILIHLSSRPRKRVVEFPSLMFLEQVEYQDSSKRRLRHIVLFLLRSLALILVAGAFARPFLDRPDAPASAPDGGRELVVLLDRSGSMAAGARMERAREAVASVAAELERGDRATLVLFDRGAAAANRATDQPAVLRSAADTVRPGDAGTRLGPALRLAESLLSGSPLPRRELVLISDFQRTGWDPEAATRMPGGTAIRTMAVGEPVANTFVADVGFGRERFSGRERVRVAATIASRGLERGDSAGERAPGAGGTELEVELLLDGRVIQSRTVSVPRAGAAAVQFDPVTLPDRAVRGTVRAATDALPADNAFHFVLNAGRSLRALVVEPRDAASRVGAPYLVRALGVSPDHEVTTITADRLPGSELAAFDVVVVNGADPTGVDGLGDFVRAGGGLILVLGQRSRSATWAGTGLLPGTIRGTRGSPQAGAALTALRVEHPVFQAFGSGTGGLTGARFYRYRELEPSGGADVLARFDDGAPAIAAGSAGRGRVIVLTSPLDGAWNDLVLQPGFVPLLHQTVRWTSGREPGPAWRTVGELLAASEFLAESPGPVQTGTVSPGRTVAGDGTQGAAGEEPDTAVVTARASDRDPGDRPVLLTPSDEPVPVDGTTLYTLRERGFYEVRDPLSGEAPVPVAVNGDIAESELATLDPAVVEAAVSGGEAAPTTASVAPEDRERRQALWWYFLVGAFVLMTAETMVSNGLSRRPLPTLTGGEG